MTAPSLVSARPTVRLKPKADARRLRHGFPWIFDSDIVMDRRTKSIAPGTLVVLQDTDRADIALCAFHPGVKLCTRVLDLDPSAPVDAAWFAARLSRAQALRAQLYDAPFYRLVHAEADGLPGVVIDRFGDIAVLQPNAAWAEAHLDALTAALVDVTGVTTVLKNASGRTRALEGLSEGSAVLYGDPPAGPIPVPMNGAIYMADLLGGQKTGLFFDQRANHAFAARLAPGARVLDVFSHVGGFALAALAAGATVATAIDGSQAALDLAAQGAAEMGQAAAFATEKGDAFDVLTARAAAGDQFDLVICDPPAFAPSKAKLEAGLRAYERVARLATALVAPGGHLVLCSCSHAATLEKFRNACTRGIGRAGGQPRLIHTGFAGPDHPQLPQLGEAGYLKALFFAL